MNTVAWAVFAVVGPFLYVVIPWIAGACVRAKARKAEPHLAHPPPPARMKVFAVLVILPVMMILGGVIVTPAMIIVGVMFLLVLTILRLIFTSNPELKHALANVTQNLGVAQFAERMREAPPSLYINVRCWHRERRHSGNSTTWVTVVTFEVNIPIQVASWYDETPALYVPSASKNSMYSIETSHLIEFSDSLSSVMIQSMLHQAYVTNSWRDYNCSVTYKTEIPGLVEKIIISEKGKIPSALSRCTYSFCRAIDQEVPYYYQLGAKLGVIKYCVVKKVSVIPEGVAAAIRGTVDPSQAVLPDDMSQRIAQHVIRCSGGSQNVPAAPQIPEYQAPAPIYANTAPLVSSSAQEARLDQQGAHQQMIAQQANQYSKEGGDNVTQAPDKLQPFLLSVDAKPSRVTQSELRSLEDIPPVAQIPAPAPIYLDEELEPVLKVPEQNISLASVDTVPTPLASGPGEW